MDLNGKTKISGSGSNCAVNGCTWSQKKLNELLNQPCFTHKPLVRKHCTCEPPFKLHKLPDDPDLQRQWFAALKRKFLPKNLFVCSYHFVDKKPTVENPAPELFLGYEKTTKKRRVLVRCKASDNRENDVVFSIDGRRKRKATGSAALDTPVAKQQCTHDDDLHESTEKSFDAMTATTEPLDDLQQDLGGYDDAQPDVVPEMKTSDMETQWEDFSLIDHGYYKTVHNVRHTGCQCDVAQDETVTSKLIKTDNDANLYTGVSRQAFLTLVDCMQRFVKKGWLMSLEDQLLMTLMKLKLNLLLADLARRFCVSVSLVSKTVKYWIDQLAVHLSDLIVWLPRETIRATMPSCFRRFPKTTCILDCAETIMQKATNLRSRGESYSNYKSHNTVKFCVAISPSGFIMHISKAYGGRVSDRFIVQDSGILERFVPGDEVMADRGFTIHDLLFSRRVKLNIPAFSQGKQLSNEDVTHTRRIANVRIHVERAIRRMKVFKILKETVPISFAKHIDKILRICAGLVNLKPPLIRDTDDGE